MVTDNLYSPIPIPGSPYKTVGVTFCSLQNLDFTETGF